MTGTHSIPDGSAIPTYLNLPIANPYHEFLAERRALPPARQERCWFEFVVLMPVGSGDLFGNLLVNVGFVAIL